jgi:DNA (cytosine-5)-methyltransferase 1
MDCRWACISAASCGAPHRRDRWFLLAYNNSESSWETNTEAEFVQDYKTSRLRYSGQARGNVSSHYWQENKHPLPGMDDGLPFEVDRAKALGNSVVAQQVKQAFKLLMGINA